MSRAIALACVLFACGAQAQTIVLNSNVQFRFGEMDLGSSSYNAEFYPWKYISQATCDSFACFTGQLFQYDNGILTNIATLLDDQEADWYSVKLGDVFDAASVGNKSFPILLEVTADSFLRNPVNVGTDDFYLGVRTGVGYLPGTPVPHRTVYGWVHMHPVNGTLTMVENVMSYNSSGIVVGTTTTVPEPTTAALLLLGMLGCGWRRHRWF